MDRLTTELAEQQKEAEFFHVVKNDENTNVDIEDKEVVSFEYDVYMFSFANAVHLPNYNVEVNGVVILMLIHSGSTLNL